MKPYWLIWNGTAKTIYVGCKHNTRPLAEKEAERLALKQPGDLFVVLEAISCVRVAESLWDKVEKFDPDAPPIEEVAADIFKDVPAEAWESVPDSNTLSGAESLAAMGHSPRNGKESQ